MVTKNLIQFKETDGIDSQIFVKPFYSGQS